MARSMPFESRRVTGVPLDSGHTKLLESMYADPVVRMGLGIGPLGEAVAAETAPTLWETGFGLWAWFDKQGEFVGRGGLRRAAVEGLELVELTCCLHPSARGKGLATELGHAVLLWGEMYHGLRDVIACSLPDQWGSRRVMQKLGMQYERDVAYLGAHRVLYRLVR